MSNTSIPWNQDLAEGIEKAVQFKRLGKYDDAKEIYLELNKKYPDNPTVFKSYAKLLAVYGSYDEAIDHFNHGIRLYEQYPLDDASGDGIFQCKQHIENLTNLPKDSDRFLSYMKSLAGNQNYIPGSALKKSKSIFDVTQKKCKLCDHPLPNYWEDVLYWGKYVHRYQCKNCGNCLIDGWNIWRKCNVCFAKSVEEKKRSREKALRVKEIKKRNTQIEQQREQQQIELERQTAKEAEINQYRKLRKEIEAMPLYQQWRQSVLKQFDRKCAVCGSTKNIEVDHRYKSFYSIINKYKITNIVQAYECAELWDIQNGAPLCKQHHDQTENSIYYNKKKNS